MTTMKSIKSLCRALTQIELCFPNLIKPLKIVTFTNKSTPPYWSFFLVGKLLTPLATFGNALTYLPDIL